MHASPTRNLRNFLIGVITLPDLLGAPIRSLCLKRCLHSVRPPDLYRMTIYSESRPPPSFKDYFEILTWDRRVLAQEHDSANRRPQLPEYAEWREQAGPELRQLLEQHEAAMAMASAKVMPSRTLYAAWRETACPRLSLSQI